MFHHISQSLKNIRKIRHLFYDQPQLLSFRTHLPLAYARSM